MNGGAALHPLRTPPVAARRQVLEGAAVTFAALQAVDAPEFTERMGGTRHAKMMAESELVLDLADETWRSVLSKAIARLDPRSLESIGPRRSPLDSTDAVVEATRDLRVDSGRLSANRVATVFGVTIAELARWGRRSKQAVAKTPDADSLQGFLEHLERVARLRIMTDGDADFRKWLRTPNPGLAKGRPIDLLAEGKWQALADKVDDMLTGAPI